MGEFNVVMYMQEKEGGNEYDFDGMPDFKNAMSDCSLKNLGYVKERMTWSIGHEGMDLILECLDRVLYTGEWLDLFPHARVFHGDFWDSDHRILHLVLDITRLANHASGRTKCFLFEPWWLLDEGCRKVIRHV